MNMKLKKCINKVLSFLTVICCLAGSAVPLYTEAAGSGDEVPTIIFENEPIPSDDLVVTKNVTILNDMQVTEAEEAAIQNQEFWFCLEIGGKPAAKCKYHVYAIGADGSWEEIKDGSSLLPKSYKTDKDGRFSLKTGQKAEFRAEEVSVLREGAEYRVTEEQTKNYRQDSPRDKDEKGNAYAQGTMTGTLTTASFINEYIPKGSANAVLEIRKSVAPVLGNPGYVLPDDPDFKFLIKINGEPWQGEYELWDTDTNTEIIGNYSSDADGIFTLKANQKAIFTKDKKGKKLTQGMQYEVRELDLPADWRAVGDEPDSRTEEIPGHKTAARKIGRTEAYNMLEFTNAEASFGVTKKAEQGYTIDPEAVFTFELKKADNTVWAGAKYYLYDTDTRQLIAPDNATDNSISYRTTEQDGHFTLQAGQTAVFVGIDTKERYSISEVPPDTGVTSTADTGASPIVGRRQYTQTHPTGTDGRPVGYTNTEGAVQEWIFRNKPLDGLTVTKKVINETGEAPADNNTEFSFKIYKVNSDGSETAQNTDYTIGEKSQRTKDGAFTLRNGETASFPYLTAGTYKVVEDVKDTPQYSVVPDSDREGNTRTTQEQTGTLTAGGTLSFTFRNYFVPHKLNLRILKTDDEGSLLAGARFKLFRDEEETTPVVPDDSENIENSGDIQNPESNEETTNEQFNDNESSRVAGINSQYMVAESPATGSDGVVTFEGLQIDTTYYLREVVAPSGYQLLAEPIAITITNIDGELTVVTDGGQEVGEITIDENNENVQIRIINDKLYELPSSGGIGIYWYSIGGMLLMMAASLILYRYKLRGEVLKD